MQHWLRQPLFGHGRVSRREVAIITRELATLLDAGLTLDQSLRSLVDLAESEALRRLLADLLRAGPGRQHARRCARASTRRVFPRVYVSMVRAGEAGGALDEVLGRLARYLDEAEALRRAGQVGAGLPDSSC